MNPSIEVPDKRVVFAHGKESGPWGIKITALAETARQRGWQVISPDYSHTPDPRLRVKQLLDLAPRARSALVLVGSSMGGYVSAFAAPTLAPQGLFLMAPAFYFPSYDEDPPAPPPINTVVHGWHDEVVPVERAIRYAQRHRATVHLLDAGHTLNDRLPELRQLFNALLENAELLGAYRCARYVVQAPGGDIHLRAEHVDGDADSALASRCGVRNHWAFVSACNPWSRRLSDDENAGLMRGLRERITADGIAHVPGYGTDASGRWPREASALICDPPAGYAAMLGCEFNQNAILSGKLGAAAQVVWLR